MDALYELKRLKRKSAVFNNELNELRRAANEDRLCDNGYKEVLHFLLENAAEKRRRGDPSSEKALALVDQEQAVKRQRQGKSKGVSAGTTTSTKPPRNVQAGTQLNANKLLLIEVKVEKEQGKTPTPVSQKRAQEPEVKVEGQQKEPEYIEIEDDDEVLENKGVSMNPEKDKVVEPMQTPVPEKSPLEKGIKIEDNNKDAKDKGIAMFSPFVPSREYQSPFNDSRDILAFRNEVLTLQRRPFNLEEYSRLQEAIIAGSYLDHYQDLKRLLLSQYKREKRLAILRGFFFWLQNLTRKGAFRPWNDCVCLEVDPPLD